MSGKKNFNVETNLYNLVKQCEDSNFPSTQAGHLWDFRDQEAELLRVVRAQGTKEPFVVPDCSKEFQRYKSVYDLRCLFHERVQKDLEIAPPKECLNRWLFNQLAVPRTEAEITVFASDKTDIEKPSDKAAEPFFRCPQVAKDSKVLHSQLLENLPGTMVIPWGKKNDVHVLKRVYQTYIEKAMYWLDKWSGDISDNTELESLGAVKNTLRDLCAEVNHSRDASELKGPLKREIVKACSSDFITSRFSVIIDSIVHEIICEAEKMVEKIRELPPLSAQDDHVVVMTIPETKERKFTFRSNTVTMSGLHYLKLKKLYFLHNLQGVSVPIGGPVKAPVVEEKVKMTCEQKNLLHRAMYVLARRYATFFGENEGAAFHAAAPESCFEVMRNDLKVTQELFASPFNCHFARFCSAFPDIDCWFGSCGSFFDFIPESGSYEVGPPYTVEVMDQMAERLEVILDESTAALSFIIFVPEWRYPIAHYHEVMDKSKYLKADVLMKGNDHAYVVGDQHTSKMRYFSLPFATRVYVLQNSLGAETWPLPANFLHTLTESLRMPIMIQTKDDSHSHRSWNRDGDRNRGGDRKWDRSWNRDRDDNRGRDYRDRDRDSNRNRERDDRDRRSPPRKYRNRDRYQGNRYND